MLASAVPAQDVVVAGPGIPATALRADGRRYLARVGAAARPATVTVTNTTDVPPFTVSGARHRRRSRSPTRPTTSASDS